MPDALGRPRPSNYATDPLLKGADWEALKVYWRAQRLACARCGRAIDYDSTPRYWRSLDVGHIVGRREAKALGWTRVQINSVGNTQPEHQRCNRAMGASARGGRRRRPTVVRRPIEADEW